MQVPAVFDHLRANGEGSRTQPFMYVTEARQFKIGGVAVGLEQFDPYTYTPEDIGLDMQGIAVDDMAAYPAVLPTYSAVIGGPKLHDWARTNPERIAQTAEVMQEVFGRLEPDANIVRSKTNTLDHFGFAAGLFADKSISLQVQGNCACLYPDPQGIYVDHPDDSGFAEYSMHNVETRIQRTSLYAGFGHLARLAFEKRNLYVV